jgi:hypothetical protein
MLSRLKKRKIQILKVKGILNLKVKELKGQKKTAKFIR